MGHGSVPIAIQQNKNYFQVLPIMFDSLGEGLNQLDDQFFGQPLEEGSHTDEAHLD
jgi:hypothetical protein